MQVAEAVVRILEKEGIEAAFGIPGAAINPGEASLADLGRALSIHHSPHTFYPS